MTERRPAAVKPCVIPGCDWRLVTEEYVGGPEHRVPVPLDVQQAASGEHMRVHYRPESTVVDLGQARRESM